MTDSSELSGGSPTFDEFGMNTLSASTSQSSLGSEPDSTTQTSTKKARRQTAFYPNMNASNKPLKPFSRSAAKRESVMTLGSIEHLQHYFTKAGIAAKKK